MNLPFDARGLRQVLASYQRPSLGRGALELLTTALPLAGLWVAALVLAAYGWWWGLVLTVPAGLFLVRLFSIQHDCGHQAFFADRAANNWTGRLLGVLTMTPYDCWRRTHAIHHATSGNLDRRTVGGIDTLTVAEYQALPLGKRIGYRLYRHPAVLLGLAPLYLFVLQNRLPVGLMKDRAAWFSVLGANLGLALLITVEVILAGPVATLAVHLPIIAVAATTGVWLFYVQHQFEDAWWSRNGDWSAHDAALLGSSHLHLPAPLRWLTANIGAHHIHHAASRIPFYRLPEVMRDHPRLTGTRVGLIGSCKALGLALWDEGSGRLVGFRMARARAG